MKIEKFIINKCTGNSQITSYSGKILFKFLEREDL